MSTLIINGVTFRVECNFNAIMAHMTRRGYKNLDFLSGEISTQEWAELMTCSINEGERLEGRRHDYTVEELCAYNLLDVMEVIKQFISIFAEQNLTEAEAKKK